MVITIMFCADQTNIIDLIGTAARLINYFSS